MMSLVLFVLAVVLGILAGNLLTVGALLGITVVLAVIFTIASVKAEELEALVVSAFAIYALVFLLCAWGAYFYTTGDLPRWLATLKDWTFR